MLYNGADTGKTCGELIAEDETDCYKSEIEEKCCDSCSVAAAKYANLTGKLFNKIHWRSTHEAGYARA